MKTSKNITTKKHTTKSDTKIDLKNSLHMTTRLKVVLLLLFVLIIGVGLTIIFFYNYYLLNITTINATVSIVEGISGFDAGNQSLNFAHLSLGNTAMKSFIITADRNVLVRVRANGDIAQFLNFSEENFYMNSGEYKHVNVTIHIPEHVTLGNYSGKVLVYFYRS